MTGDYWPTVRAGALLFALATILVGGAVGVLGAVATLAMVVVGWMVDVWYDTKVRQLRRDLRKARRRAEAQRRTIVRLRRSHDAAWADVLHVDLGARQS